jgi:hypothetical protein
MKIKRVLDNFVIVTLSAVGYAADTVTLTQVDDD